MLFLRLMKITIEKGMDSKQDVLVYGMSDKGSIAEKGLQQEIAAAIKRKNIAPDKFGTTYSTTFNGKKVLVISLGKEKELTGNHLRRVLGKTVKYTQATKQVSFCTDLLRFFSLPLLERGRCAADRKSV